MEREIIDRITKKKITEKEKYILENLREIEKLAKAMRRHLRANNEPYAFTYVGLIIQHAFNIKEAVESIWTLVDLVDLWKKIIKENKA